MWGFWQASVRDSQFLPLGIWKKVMFSLAENSPSFEKQVLVLYWTLEKTKFHVIGHQASYHKPKMPIMTWVVSDT